MQGDYPKSLEYLEEALILSQGISDKINEAIILNNLSLSFRRKGDLDKAIKYAKNSLQIYEERNDKLGMGTPLQILGAIHESQGNYTAAISCFSRAQQAWEEVGYKKGVANILSSFGVLNFNLGNYEKALSYHKQYLKTHQDLGNRHHMLDGYLEIGGVYTAMNKLDSALHYYEETLRLQNELDVTYATGYVFHDLGVVYHKKGNLDEAIISFEKALHHNEKVEDYEEVVKTLIGLANTYFDDQQYEEAIGYAEKSLALATANDHKNIIQGAYNTLARSYASLNKYEEAYAIQEKQMALRVSIFNSENATQIAKMNSKFEVEKKEQQIVTLEHINELSALRRNILIGSTIIIVFVAFLLFNPQRLRSKRNKDLLEKEKDLDRVKSKFFANISHEFRTPLTLILGPLEEIKQNVADEKTLRHLGLMQKNAGKLLNQVNQLLELSKLDAGQLKPKVVRKDIVLFIKGITMSFESLATSRKVDLSFSAENESIVAYFDENSIEKIITNLLSNAFKFTTASDKVSVAIKQTYIPLVKGSPGTVEIMIKDTGKGFDEDQHKYIFERYYHSDSDMQASTGIGLALVKELVESHSGGIKVTSTKGIGSEFTIVLPLGKSHWHYNQIVEENKNDPKSITTNVSFLEEKNVYEDSAELLGNKESILIIEDNADLRKYIKEVLNENFQILEAANGKEGINKAQEFLPDLIITDIMMAEMDGFEVTRDLKQSEKTCHIPVILLTAKADKESRLTGLETQADDYMTKPFEQAELLARINNLISSRKKLREQFSKTVVLRPKDIAINSVDEVFLEKVMVSIEENLDNTAFSVECLGQSVGMSRSQIHRKLKALTGLPPNKFIRNMRLGRAMELLKNNVGTVAEVSYMTGFGSPNYFNKCFHDLYGHAPGEVKKQA